MKNVDFGVLHLILVKIHGKKKFPQTEKNSPQQSGTDLSPNWNVPEVFTTFHKGAVDGRKYSEECSIPM